MKRVFTALLLLLIYINVSAQGSKRVKNLPNYDQRLWHFGFTVGCNQMGFRIDRCDDFFDRSDIWGIEATKFTGFHLGPISNLRLNRYLDLRMMFNLSFNQRDLTYYYKEADQTKMLNHNMSIHSTMLEFPVCIKYKAERWVNFAPYVIAGFNYKYDIGAKKEPKAEELPKIKLQSHDPSLEWGGGFDIYMQYFKLSVELKYSMGFNNILKYDDSMYTNSINKLTSNALILSLHFE